MTVIDKIIPIPGGSFGVAVVVKAEGIMLNAGLDVVDFPIIRFVNPEVGPDVGYLALLSRLIAAYLLLTQISSDVLGVPSMRSLDPPETFRRFCRRS